MKVRTLVMYQIKTMYCKKLLTLSSTEIVSSLVGNWKTLKLGLFGQCMGGGLLIICLCNSGIENGSISRSKASSLVIKFA